MRGRVWGGVVFCEKAGAVVGGEEEDGVDGEERHVGRHGCGSGGALGALGWGVDWWVVVVVSWLVVLKIEALL